MVFLVKQEMLAPNLSLGDGSLGRVLASGNQAFTVVNGVLETFSRPWQVARVTLDSEAIVVDEADDFASLELFSIPDSNYIIAGCVVDLDIDSVASFTTNQADTIDVAIGTVATTSTTFANAGEDNIVAKIDGVGATTVGTVTGATTASEDMLFVLGSTTSVYLNVAGACTSNGTVTFSGTLTFVYLDLGVGVA